MKQNMLLKTGVSLREFGFALAGHFTEFF